MTKINRTILKELKEVAEKLPEYDEPMYVKRNPTGLGIKRKDERRYIGADRHFKRLKSAYKRSGDKGVFEYIRKHGKTQRRRFGFLEFIKFYLFGIKPKGMLVRK